MTLTRKGTRIMRKRMSAVMLAATLLGGCSESSTAVLTEEAALTVLRPLCRTPAPLVGRPNTSEPNYLVAFKAGVDASSESTRLARVYGFTVTHVFYAGTGGFAASLSPREVAIVRCEASVAQVGYDLLLTHARVSR